jgi:hypothetical protein
MIAAMRRCLTLLAGACGCWWCAEAAPVYAAAPKPGPPIQIQRAAGPIVVDGDLSDPGWKGIAPITVWFETNVGDNVEPQVKNVGYLAYDDKYLYAAFHFEDPHPEMVRAPLGDHDNVSSATDYAGVIVDSRNDGKTARMFLSNPSGVQYDAVSSDVTGEDSSPDFYWDSMGKITATGWDLEIRIPFSSLRYSNETSPTWGIMLYRNYPRDRRYQFFSNRLPRDVNCFICNSSKMNGLLNLPRGSHLVLAPFATASRTDEAPELGSPLETGDVKPEAGLDLKWSPFADGAIDATVNPDFSQVESDVAQIGANERFALFYPEKRPFFLEGIDLFTTPFQAVYTRSITSPSWGLRTTGRAGTTAFTVLATHDRGGGSVILPGPQGSDTAPQDFGSDVGVARFRYDRGPSFVSVLATGRSIDGGGHNVVFGPDAQWRPRPSDAFTGQALWSDSRTPNRPDLAGEWDGRTLADHAWLGNWSHNTPRWDWFIQGLDIGPEFRADEGFIPQVGYRELYVEPGYTIRPKDVFLSRVRLFTVDYVDADTTGGILARRISVGVGMDGKLNSFTRVELNRDDIRVGSELLHRFRPRVYMQLSPTRLLNLIELDSYFGDEIDFDNAREGSGLTLVSIVILHVGDHLELRNDASGRWLHETTETGITGRLFAASVERLRTTWSFSSRSFVRLIGQYVLTTRNPSMYTFAVPAKDADLSGSALFAYKLNWQTVFYLGYGDNRTYTDVTSQLEPNTRDAFAKISYAWQR